MGRRSTQGSLIAPLLHAYEGVPSTLERSQIVAVLEATKNDISPMGLRDYAMPPADAPLIPHLVDLLG